jgi:hypothetical protein
MTNPFLDPAWFAALADRLPGRSAGAPVAFETIAGDAAAVRHTLVVAGGFVEAWDPGWDHDTSVALRLSAADTLALCTGGMQVWNSRIPVELLVRGDGGVWNARPLPPFDLAGLDVPEPARRRDGPPLRWAELQAGSPFGNLDLLLDAGTGGAIGVEPRPAAIEPELRAVARYHHVLEGRAGRRSWLGMFEDGGWIAGPDPAVEELIEIFDRLGADERYRLPAAIADPLIALSDLVVHGGCGQIGALLELEPAGLAP